MSAPYWYHTAHTGQEGFRRLVATRWAFRAILHTLMPPSFAEEFFGDRGAQS